MRRQRQDQQADLMKRTPYSYTSSAALPPYFAPFKIFGNKYQPLRQLPTDLKNKPFKPFKLT